MKSKKFTPEEIVDLKRNAYTKSVSRNQIRFKEIFKEDLWKAWLNGENPVDFFESHGYDPEVIGKKRIENTIYSLAVKHYKLDDHHKSEESRKNKNESGKSKDPAELSDESPGFHQLGEAEALITGNSGSCFQIIQELLSDPDMPLSVSELCSIYGVSRSGYYNWLHAEPVRKKREEKDRADFELILEAFKKRGVQKGARSIHMQLLHSDPPVVMNPKKIWRLMRKFNLDCTIRSEHPHKSSEKVNRPDPAKDNRKENGDKKPPRRGITQKNLVKREFELHGPRSILLTDVTYIPYADTVAYLSTVLDAYTKQILAYVVSSDMEVDLVLETINQLIENNQLTLSEETIIHSDQGACYASVSFIDLVRSKHLRQSMSRRGNCWDNACQESFFGHMKDETRDQIDHCQTLKEVQDVIDSWMDYYNNERYQWDLAKLSPNQFYEFITTGVYPLEGVTTPNIRVGKMEK